MTEAPASTSAGHLSTASPSTSGSSAPQPTDGHYPIPDSEVRRQHRRLANAKQTAAYKKISERSVRNYHRQRVFPGYRMAGVNGLLFDLDEVDAEMKKRGLPKVAGGYASYGGGEVIDLTPTPQAVVSNDRLPQKQQTPDLDAQAQAVLDSLPPMTDEQVQKIAGLLSLPRTGQQPVVTGQGDEQ